MSTLSFSLGWLLDQCVAEYTTFLLAGDWAGVLLSTLNFSLGRLLDQYVTEYTTFQLAGYLTIMVPGT